MKEIKAMIVDDEALARINIRQALEDHEHWNIVAELDNGKELKTILKKYKPDVIFLDIKMPGKSGMALAKELLSLKSCPLIVFVTAYDEYAVNAFELCAFDYLLKPFNDQRFKKTILRLESVLNQPEHDKFLQKWQSKQLNSIGKLTQIIIRSIGSIRIIEIEDVFWFSSNGNYVEVHHKEGMHLHRASLNYLESHLVSDKFCRVHRSAIIKLKEVKELKTMDDNSYVIILSNGNEVKLSSAYKNKLFSLLGL